MADSRQKQDPRDQSDEVAEHDDSHGQSTAAWAAVGIIMLGALIMSIAVVIASVPVFVAGVVVVVLGAAAGKVLSAMGFGASGKPGH